VWSGLAGTIMFLLLCFVAECSGYLEARWAKEEGVGGEIAHIGGPWTVGGCSGSSSGQAMGAKPDEAEGAGFVAVAHRLDEARGGRVKTADASLLDSERGQRRR
jgi:hypothetical protein